MCESEATFGFDELTLGDSTPAVAVVKTAIRCLESVGYPIADQEVKAAVPEMPRAIGLCRWALIIMTPPLQP
jgi:hypothetical protein